jgi:hypothetical protein
VLLHRHDNAWGTEEKVPRWSSSVNLTCSRGCGDYKYQGIRRGKGSNLETNSPSCLESNTRRGRKLDEAIQSRAFNTGFSTPDFPSDEKGQCERAYVSLQVKPAQLRDPGSKCDETINSSILRSSCAYTSEAQLWWVFGLSTSSLLPMSNEQSISPCPQWDTIQVFGGFNRLRNYKNVTFYRMCRENSTE